MADRQTGLHFADHPDAVILGIGDAIAKREEKERLRAKGKPTDELEDKLSELLGYAGTIGTPLNQLDARLVQKKDLLKQTQNRDAALVAELARRLQQQDFKPKMSITFAILVGVVIAGFFVLAFRAPNLRGAGWDPVCHAVLISDRDHPNSGSSASSREKSLLPYSVGCEGTSSDVQHQQVGKRRRKRAQRPSNTFFMPRRLLRKE